MSHNGSRPPGFAGHHEDSLRRLVRSSPGVAVLTGGQTGVDTLAARAALRAGLPVHLIFPAGFRQEDGALTAAPRRALTGASLHELSSGSFRYRTWTSVYLTDVVILLDPAGGDGCRETVRAAERLGRPLMSPGTAPVRAGELAAWLGKTRARILMVAGCRASLLASQGKTTGLRSQIAAITSEAKALHTQLVAAATASE